MPEESFQKNVLGEKLESCSVDPLTGQMTESGSRGAILEAFIAGTEPGTIFQR